MLNLNKPIKFPANIFLDKDVLKSSWRRLSSLPLEGAFKTNVFAFVLLLQKTSWRRLDQDQYIRLGHTSWRSVEDILKTSSSCLQDILKMSSRHLHNVLQRCLQEVFKTYHQAKLLMLKRVQDVFWTYSTRF